MANSTVNIELRKFACALKNDYGQYNHIPKFYFSLPYFDIEELYGKFMQHRSLHPGPMGYHAFGLWVHDGGLEVRDNQTFGSYDPTISKYLFD